MDDSNWLRIQRNWVYLLNNLDTDDLLPFLYQENVINDRDKEQVEKETSSYRQRDKLLTILKRKEHGYEKLCKWLHDKQPFILEKLEKAVKDVKDIISCSVSGLKDPTPSNKCARTLTSNLVQDVTPLWNHYPCNSSGNMRAQKDETDAVCNQRLLVDLAKSVGIIKSPFGSSGTGFRVGSDYVMTAKHVKDYILKEAQFHFNELSPCIIHLSDAFIDFSFEVDGLLANDSLKFFFEPEIVFENEEMDTVILRLKPNTLVEYPPPLTSFAKLSDPCGQMYFIGHSKADIKKTDKFCCVQLNCDNIVSAERWSLQHVGRNGFKGINNPHRVLLHCTFEKGASGSPGVCIYHENHNIHAKIVTMLLCGYPEWFYDTNISKEKRDGTPHDFCIEQGVNMRSLAENMKVTKPNLWQQIFCYSCDDDDDDDVEMKLI